MSNIRLLTPGDRLPASLRPPGSGWTNCDYACAALEAGFLLAWAPVLVTLPFWVSTFLAPAE